MSRHQNNITYRRQLQNGPIPLYYQLQRDLAERIRSGEFQVGAALPTEKQICTTYGVSRITVRCALNRLLQDRLISRRRGVGTFVAEPQDPVKSLSLVGSLDELVFNTKDLSYRLLSRKTVDPSPWVAGALELPPGARAIRLETINHAGGESFACGEFFFAEPLGIRLPDADLRASVPIIRIVEKTAGERVSRAEQIVEPSLVDRAVADRLGIKPRSPVLQVLRTYYTEGGRPVAAAIMRCHPERYRYTVQLFAQPWPTSAPEVSARDERPPYDPRLAHGALREPRKKGTAPP